MKVLLETQLIYFGREYEPGEEVDMPDDEARRFIARGYAVECAAVAPMETATLPQSRPRHARNTTAGAKA